MGCAAGEHSTEAFEKAGFATGRQGSAAITTAGTSGGNTQTGSEPGPDSLGAAGAVGTSGTSAPSGAAAGTGGTAGVSAGDALAPDAGADASSLGGPCPPSFECFTDPLFGLLHGCLKSGALPAPLACMTDADCVAGGLPKGLCLMEEETGLNGCVQLCTPEPDAATP